MSAEDGTPGAGVDAEPERVRPGSIGTWSDADEAATGG